MSFLRLTSEMHFNCVTHVSRSWRVCKWNRAYIRDGFVGKSWRSQSAGMLQCEKYQKKRRGTKSKHIHQYYSREYRDLTVASRILNDADDERRIIAEIKMLTPTSRVHLPVHTTRTHCKVFAWQEKCAHTSEHSIVSPVVLRVRNVVSLHLNRQCLLNSRIKRSSFLVSSTETRLFSFFFVLFLKLELKKWSRKIQPIFKTDRVIM